MGIFVSVPKTAECIVAALAFAALLCFTAYKPLGVLQSSGYKNGKFVKWLKKKDNVLFTRLTFLSLMCLFSSAVIGLCFSFAGEWAAVVSLAPFIVFFAVYLWADRKIALRSASVFTPRFKRLYVILFTISAVFAYIIITLLNFADAVWGNEIFSALRYCPLALLPLALIGLILLSNLVAAVYEVPHNRKFVRKATVKLKNYPIKVIGITGSYGKTSTKFILNAVLSSKYRVLTTPRSHNTPIGIALAINNANLSEYDIFIAEMGARHVGDIAELCEICPPDISLITGICGQHMETFGTFANVVKAKGEILTYTKESAITAADCYELFAEYPVNIKKCLCASDIACTKDGTSFTLTLGGESKRAHTRLLGAHAAENIALAAEAAFAVGMTLDEIVCAIENIDFIEHRLQLIKSGDVNILDDGYNSNVKGARAALKVLKLFDGRKIVVTPGLVELGVLEKQENSALGSELAGFDMVILVGDTLVQPVREGYLQNGGDAEKIIVCQTLAAAQEQLKNYLHAGDTVLFLNDLPDVV